MTVLEKRPGLQPHSEFETEFGEAELNVERTDITFHDLAGDKVLIQVTVCNTGTRSSAPTPMRLESAPLGAFVPWKPLAQLVVPALEPGESREMSIEVPRPRPAPLGDFNRVPPKNLLTAVNAAAESPKEPRQSFNSRLADAMRWRQKLFSARATAVGKTSLAQDLWDLSGRGQPHWAGNINVFIGRKPVERHLSRALRIYPGRTNMAMFVVGEAGKREAYSFELAGLSSGWKTVMYETTHNKNLLADPSDAPIKETQWVEAAGSLMVMLATHPPVDCKAGKLEVHVTRRSSGDSAIVEFDLDPAAQGTGCYYV
jgi:hypothetical protein